MTGFQWVLTRPVVRDQVVLRGLQFVCFALAGPFLALAIRQVVRFATTPGEIFLGVLACGGVTLLFVLLGMVVPSAAARRAMPELAPSSGRRWFNTPVVSRERVVLGRQLLCFAGAIMTMILSAQSAASLGESPSQIFLGLLGGFIVTTALVVIGVVLPTSTARVAR